MRSKILLLVILLHLSIFLSAQKIQMLTTELSNAKTDTNRLRVLNEIAEYFYIGYDYTQCKEYSLQALLLSDKLLQSTTIKQNAGLSNEIKYWNAVSRVNYGSAIIFENPSSAMDSVLLSEQIWSKANHKKGLAFVYGRLADLSSLQSNHQKALDYNEKSIKFYTELKDTYHLANIYYQRALFQRYMGYYGDAMENNITALEMAKESKDSSLVVECLLANGFIYMFVKEFSLAIAAQQEAMKVATAMNDSSYIATIYSDMGNVHMRDGKLDSALQDFKNCFNLRKRLNETLYLSNALLYISHILLKQGKIEQALATQFEALQYAKNLKEGTYVLDVYADIAVSTYKLNYLQQSLTYNDTLLLLSTKYKNSSYSSIALQGIANVNLKQGKRAAAIVALKKAISITNTDDYRNLKEIYAGLLTAQEKSGNYKEAFHNAMLYKRFCDSVETMEKSTKLVSLTNQLEFQNKRALLEVSQEKELALKQSEIRQQKLFRNLSIGSLIIVIIFALSYFKRFREKRKLNIQLEQTVTNLKATQKQLIQSEKMASLGELTAGIAHEIQNPLNFVNNFSEVSKELLDEMKQTLEKGYTDDAKEIMQDVVQNLEKIKHHGKRADAIVKGMLQHSRKSEGKKEPTDINALCDEYVRLSYHGLRAKDKSFNAKFETNFDASLPKINIVPQDIGRVILNLINNAFYAASQNHQQKAEGTLNAEHKKVPTVWVNTKKQGDKVLISVKDNGRGIPKENLEKIFQPFFTTKPSGSGTGLGLSLSFDIVRAHAGELKVETLSAEAAAQAGKDGEETEFIIILPVV